MDFIERLQGLSKKIVQVGATLETEEATKNALIMPFLHSVLGYDVFDPTEVVPEFNADTGTKKGEKVDYALLKDGEVQILIECKKFGEKLSTKHASQLFRYFSVTNARIAILTNGEVYEFYTDLDAPNKMDEKPFLTLNMSDLDEHIVPEVKKLTKSSFDVDSVVDAAGELKYLNQIKKVLQVQFKNPEEDFVKFFTSRVYDGVQTAKVKAQFLEITSKALKQFLNDSINDRLKSAIGTNEEVAIKAQAPVQSVVDTEITLEQGEEDKPRVVTTEEETDGFNIVKAILRAKLDVSRITARDTQSYFGILLDDNNRKPLCRLHFNAKQKYIGITGEDKKETRHPIESLDDIYGLSDKLLDNAARFE
ncbi:MULTISPECIES: type I restriction endonuclease [Vibrio]|uniref:Restriction endonuclease n=1 Tax=Vibrio tasmaniensis TaxID=212663 RepID=A0A2N7NE95_9VIBR|nr:type I restriction endonuclease [Vibrio tasmaniensis]PMP11277.1 restriction endonuclease [Vibrio tasmaniensis]TKG32433.1 restriction endonuclease [Vibrio tasmaniensis]TKG37944.1 restriction endonuclease [Vibrio tasmaniensis]TKG46393.1 restriction endonuclease [Vibrio tasmaniensis]TKG47294.1 restriction endonuclease [Vibrio tasmaniensis]